MDIKNLVELEKVIALCRKKGVKSFKIDGIEVELSSEIPQSNYKRKQDQSTDLISTHNVYDEEAALFWSSAGLPDEKVAS